MGHEDTKSRRKPRVLRVFVPSWLILLSLQTAITAQAPMRAVDTGARSLITSARQVVVRTPTEWDALWREHQPAAAKPAVDFSKEMIVAVFGGSRPTSGFEIAIVGAAEQGGVLRVRYRETPPPADAITAQVITFPFQIAAIPTPSAKDVKFEKVP